MPFQSKEMNDYFASLPSVVQQAILQSGLEPKTMAELESVANKMQDAHENRK